jgi:hypothetical protein
VVYIHKNSKSRAPTGHELADAEPRRGLCRIIFTQQTIGIGAVSFSISKRLLVGYDTARR